MGDGSGGGMKTKRTKSKRHRNRDALVLAEGLICIVLNDTV